jgi:hypothetical protein
MLFTRHFRTQSGSVDAVVVTFFLDEPPAKSSGRGFAFDSKEAAATSYRDLYRKRAPSKVPT